MLTIAELLAAQKESRRINCPHCGARLNAQFRVVIATRNCPHCGKRVVAEPEADGAPPFTREQLDAACTAYRRSRWWAGLILVTAFLLLYGCMFASVRLETTVEQFIPAGCFAIPLVVLVPGSIAYWGFVLFRRAGREALKCPQCSTPCSVAWDDHPNLTQLTGNCTGCGVRLAEVSVHEAPVAALPTASEYKQSATRHARRTRLGLFALIACLAVLFIPLILVLTDESIMIRFLADMRAWYGPSGMARVVAIAMLALFAGTQGILWAGVYVLHRIKKQRVRANPLLRCPYCDAELVRIPEVIATRRCPACRRRVLAEPVAGP